MMSPITFDLLLCVFLLLLSILSQKVSARPSRKRSYDGEHTDSSTKYLRHVKRSAEKTHLREEVEEISRELDLLKMELERTRKDINEKMETLKTLSQPPTIEESCRTEFTWWFDTVGKTLEYLDNFDVHCRRGEFLRQWRLTWGERENGKKAIRFMCCKFLHVYPS